MFQRLTLALLTLLLLGSCSNPFQTQTNTVATPTLTGYWKSSFGDGFEISGTSFKQYDDSAKTLSFSGTIVNTPNLAATSGSLTLQITNAGSWGKTVGTFYVARWKSLVLAGVQESSAANPVYSSPTPQPTTQAAAEATFTDAYFGFYGDYAKQ